MTLKKEYPERPRMNLVIQRTPLIESRGETASGPDEKQEEAREEEIR